MKILIIDAYPMKASSWLSPLIKDLGKNDDVVLDYVNIDHHSTKDWKDELIQLKKSNFIRNYYLGPNHSDLFSITLFFIKLKRKLNFYEYDKVIATDLITLLPRYILYYCKNNCEFIDVRFQNGYLTHYLNTEKITPINIENIVRFINKSSTTKYNIFSKILARLKQSFRFFLNNNQYYFYFYILPKILINKSLLKNSLESKTHISQDSDIIVVFDSKEKKIMKTHYRNVCVCDWPINKELVDKNNALAKLNSERKLLTPISGYGAHRKFTKKELSLYKRDLLIVIKYMKINTVVIRPHTRFNSNTSANQLQRFLNKNNINTEIDYEKKDIETIVHNYKVVAGFASHVLIDVLRASDDVIVIGFEEISKTRYKDPIQVLLTGENIGLKWIKHGGVFDRKIFLKRKMKYTKRMSIAKLVLHKPKEHKNILD